MSPDEIKMFLRTVKYLSNVRSLFVEELMMLENILLKYPPNASIKKDIKEKLINEDVLEGACVKFILFKNEHRLKSMAHQFMKKKKMFMTFKNKSRLSI